MARRETCGPQHPQKSSSSTQLPQQAEPSIPSGSNPTIVRNPSRSASAHNQKSLTRKTRRSGCCLSAADFPPAAGRLPTRRSPLAALRSPLACCHTPLHRLGPEHAATFSKTTLTLLAEMATHRLSPPPCAFSWSPSRFSPCYVFELTKALQAPPLKHQMVSCLQSGTVQFESVLRWLVMSRVDNGRDRLLSRQSRSASRKTAASCELAWYSYNPMPTEIGRQISDLPECSIQTDSWVRPD